MQATQHTLTTGNLRPRLHCSVFEMMRFCCSKATHKHYSVFVHERREKRHFLCIHVDLPDNKYGAKDIRFCAFTLLRFCEAHCWMLERFRKPLFLCIHTDQRFKNLHFCGYPLLIAFSKTSVFVAFLRRSL